MGMKKTASASMLLLRKELISGLPEKELEIRQASRGGDTLKLVVDDYGFRLRQMSDRCAQQRKWLIERAMFPKFYGSQVWFVQSRRHLDFMTNEMAKRIEPLCSTVAGVNTAAEKALQNKLQKEYDKTSEKLELNLQAQHDEVVNSAGKRLLKVFSYLCSVALGFCLAVLLEHLKKKM